MGVESEEEEGRRTTPYIYARYHAHLYILSTTVLSDPYPPITESLGFISALSKFIRMYMYVVNCQN